MEILKNTLNNILENVKRVQRLDIPDFINRMEDVFKENGFRSECNECIENILVIRLDAIGDNVLNSGFLRELRNNYPKAHITLVVNPIVYPLVELCPYVNEILAFRVSYGSFIEQFLLGMEFCEQYLWKKHYNKCFCPRWDFDKYFATFLAYMSGAKERIAYSEKLYDGKARVNAGFDLLLSKAVINPKNIIHEAERNFYLLKAEGLQINNTNMELWYSMDDVMTAQLLINNYADCSGKYIVVAVGANENNKAYPKDLIGKALQRIGKHDEKFVILGGSNDKEAGAYLSNLLPKSVIDLTGKTTLRQSAAILARAKMYIGNDTGLKHIAAAAGIPVLEVNREAENLPKTIISLYERFLPWQVPAIVLRPKKAIGECGQFISQGGCIKNEPHCICQIKPNDIVEGYNNLVKIIFNSK